MVDQQREPAELVYVLGGQLAIRQVRRYMGLRVVGLTGPGHPGRQGSLVLREYCDACREIKRWTHLD